MNPTGAKNILIVAGEASGDLHGANLVKELLKIDPDTKFFGIGGDMMKDAGVNITYHVKDMAVVGIFEVMGKFSLIRKALRDMESLMDIIKPEAVILIDYPGFNLRIAKKASARGIKVLYYISPQVWAWHKSRVNTIARVVDKMLVVFPFEVPLYKEAGVDVEFVGHPLMDVVPSNLDKNEARERLGLKDAGKVIGLLPGSRKREVSSLLPEMLQAAKLISKKIDGIRFVIPTAGTLDIDYVKGFVSGSGIDAVIFKGRAYETMAASDLVLIASGTATLETAIIGTPMIMAYKVSPLTYIIGKMLVDIDFFSLPNIVAGKGVIKELIQGEATGERMAAEAVRILDDKEYMEEIKNGLKIAREALGSPGASRRAAGIVWESL